MRASWEGFKEIFVPVLRHTLYGIAIFLGTFVLGWVGHRLTPEYSDDIGTIEHVVILSAFGIISTTFLVELVVIGWHGIVKAAKGNHNGIFFWVSI